MENDLLQRLQNLEKGLDENIKLVNQNRKDTREMIQTVDRLIIETREMRIKKEKTQC